MNWKRQWPWFLAVFGVATCFVMSARSQQIVDLVNLPLGKEGPYLTFFTKGSTVTMSVSNKQRCHFFGGYVVSPADGKRRASAVKSPVSGYHQVEIGERSREEQHMLGTLSARPFMGSRKGFEFALPIWLAILPATCLPLGFWQWKRWRQRNGDE